VLARLREGHRVLEATSVNDPAVVAALRASDVALGVVLGCDVFSRRTLDALAFPLYNLHLGDPAFVRGLPPAFWEVLAGRDEVRPTLHRLTATLDGGDMILQETVPVAWRPTLRGTLVATHARLMAAVPAMVETGLRGILDGSARPRTIVPGPLRTTPTIGQLVAAARMCRARAAAARSPD
jgi:methionyl-tRNA formyltransferase